MSKITITFDGLCAFFTGRLNSAPDPELIVGLIDVSDFDEAEEQDFHHPVVTIKSAGRLLKKYEGFVVKADEIYEGGHAHFAGTVSLVAAEGTQKIHKLMPGDDHSMSDHNRMPFDNFVMIERDLYENADFKVDINRCKARLIFKNGLLYSLRGQDNLTFNDMSSNATVDLEQVTTMPALEISFDDDSFVVLHFNGPADDFVFKGGLNYQVSVTNHPATPQDHEHNRLALHYRYYYDLIKTNRPAKIFVPEVSEEPSLGSPSCMPGGFDEP